LFKNGGLMYSKKLEIGIEAVKMAMPLVKKIQKELSGKETITKLDKSPVTIADFSSQAIICRILNKQLPDIPIVGEEDSKALKNKENVSILEKIYSYIEKDDDISKILSRDNLFESIDLGGASTSELFWTLDPIDGTKGFLRGEQFVIALGLIEKGNVKIGILGCPNLKFKKDINDSGYIIYAVKGEGTFLYDLSSGKREQVEVSKKSKPSDMRFIQSYESAHGNLKLQKKIADKLGITIPSLQMDSQVKYGLVASGEAEIYLRIPNENSPDYKEKIWDHAAGSVIVEEAGGIVTDINGRKLDFGKGETLKDNSGIIATTPLIAQSLKQTVEKLLEI
jgi:3'(2'), 5'-bisphosphate nucleotidase